MATAVAGVRAEREGPPRWLLFVSGALWLLIGLTLLSLDATSVATLGYMIGFVVLIAGVDEVVMLFVAPSWKWLHGLAAVLFLLIGIGALLEPFQTFGILALFVGWWLLIKGAFDIAAAIGFRALRPLWGLTLAVGIVEMLLGFWALGYPGRSAWLLLVWTGVGALVRGIGDIVAGFTDGDLR